MYNIYIYVYTMDVWGRNAAGPAGTYRRLRFYYRFSRKQRLSHEY